MREMVQVGRSVSGWKYILARHSFLIDLMTVSDRAFYFEAHSVTNEIFLHTTVNRC
jgi:hypothetical protein